MAKEQKKKEIHLLCARNHCSRPREYINESNRWKFISACERHTLVREGGRQWACARVYGHARWSVNSAAGRQEQLQSWVRGSVGVRVWAECWLGVMTSDKEFVTLVRTAISYWKDFYSEGAGGHQEVVSRAKARSVLCCFAFFWLCRIFIATCGLLVATCRIYFPD